MKNAMIFLLALMLAATCGATGAIAAGRDDSGPGQTDDKGGTQGGKGADDPVGKQDDKGGTQGGKGADDPAGKQDDNGGRNGSSGSGSSGSGSGKPEDNSGSGSGSGSGCTCRDDNGARGDETAENRIRRNFEVPAAGASIAARGYVELRFDGTREKFKVEVETRAPDGTVFLVTVNGLAVGVVRMVAGEGELEIDNHDGRTLPAPLRPLTAVRRVEVFSGADVILRRDF